MLKSCIVKICQLDQGPTLEPGPVSWHKRKLQMYWSIPMRPCQIQLKRIIWEQRPVGQSPEWTTRSQCCHLGSGQVTVLTTRSIEMNSNQHDMESSGGLLWVWL